MRGPGAYMEEGDREPDWDSYYDDRHHEAKQEAAERFAARRENHPNRQVGRERFGT